MKKLQDKKIPFIFTSSPNANKRTHAEVVAFLVNVLDALGIPCNYDHIITSVPIAKDIPLHYHDHYGTHKADISFMIGDDIIVLIDVKTRSLKSKFYQRMLKRSEKVK